ncbi:molybdopterin converting factor subunit 1 [Aliikangiella sp. G2MR2-5]|uniref:molybdopterin converting factor subunit 1 n=1 Tax=Aliikangiella sp. G2MR2-5 TaxID=2788943 RepID=UPI0018AB2929|nr:molybdopterin converting factor subunit 1 [Aliikangiella sp. G2MR2-5]
MKVEVLFFASFKEQLDCSRLSIDLASGDHVSELCELLSQRGPEWLELFGNPANMVKVSVNQEMAEFNKKLNEGDEVAFFPPVTGG